MRIFALVVNANRLQTAPSTSQIHWSFKVRNICVLFSSHFWQSHFLLLPLWCVLPVMRTSRYPIKKPSIREIYWTTCFDIFMFGLKEPHIPSRRGHATPLLSIKSNPYTENQLILIVYRIVQEYCKAYHMVRKHWGCSTPLQPPVSPSMTLVQQH